MEQKLLSNQDVWFKANLEALLGGEAALVKAGKQEVIDRQSLAMWILKHIEQSKPVESHPQPDNKPDFEAMAKEYVYPDYYNMDVEAVMTESYKAGCERIWEKHYLPLYEAYQNYIKYSVRRVEQFKNLSDVKISEVEALQAELKKVKGDLEKEFEETKPYPAWINSDIYPNGKIHTREYVKWLEAELKKTREERDMYKQSF